MAIAFFDMDKTLLSASSGILYVKYLLKRRLVNPVEALGVLTISAQYSLNLLNFPKAMARMCRVIRGGSAPATRALCDQWFDDCLIRYIAPQAVQRMREHEQRGDTVMVLSASTQFAVGPVARHLNVPFCCTELEIDDDKFTGQVVGQHCYAEGKAYWAGRIARERGVALGDCTAYTDSYSDRAMLELVGHPVAINPDSKLLALARSKGWPVEQFY
jgi:HAD superfamily hydrolase (TIGR01490 family)